MKDKKLKLEEIEVSHTVTRLSMGRSCPGEREDRGQGTRKWRGCRCFSAVRYTIFNWSHRIRHMGEGSVVKKTMNLCACVSEQRDHVEGAGVHVIADFQTLVCLIQAHVVKRVSS